MADSIGPYEGGDWTEWPTRHLLPTSIGQLVVSPLKSC